MKVRDVMTVPVVTVHRDTTFRELVHQLLAHDISGLPVVDDDQRVIGIVTEADLVSKEAYGYRRRRPLGLLADFLAGHDPQWVRKASGRTAGDLMTTAPATAAPDEAVTTAARRMLEGGHKRLPVVVDGRVVGIVTRHDLLRPFQRSDGEIATAVNELLADPVRVPETHRVRPIVAAGVVTLTGDVQWPRDIALFEAVIARVPGVVAVESRLVAREPEPTVQGLETRRVV